MSVRSSSNLAHGDTVALLGSLPLFRGLDAETLAAIAAELEWLSIPGGATLFTAGDQSDSMYVVAAGCLGVYNGVDGAQFLSRIQAGEPVGEMGVLSGRPRSATVRALRDSDLARLSREAFERTIVGRPAALLRVAQLVSARLETIERRAVATPPRTYAVLPQDDSVDAAGFGSQLLAALSRLGRAAMVHENEGDNAAAWFHHVESANDFVIYVGSAAPSEWTRLCARQADSVLLVARAEAPARQWPVRPEGTSGLELVLLHAGSILPGAAARWLAVAPGVAHHHVCGPDDVARLGRLLTGRAVGLVLSGGGARGFAHIGVVQAFREAGVPIDLVGGTSIGAVIGAGVAFGWSTDEMTTRFCRSMGVNRMNDYTLPFVSLVSGRKVDWWMRESFGDGDIEDLRLPFYAVSANLTTGQSSVHRQGNLCQWLRASIAIPGVLPPVFHQGQVYVDGGAINNLPIDVMRASNRGVIVGVDVASEATLTCDAGAAGDGPLWKRLLGMGTRPSRPTIVQILLRAGMVNSDTAAAASRQLADVLLQPPLEGIDMMHWRASRLAIALGHQYASRRIGSLDDGLRARLGLSPGS